MKRFLIRQLSLALALVMLLTLTGLAEDLSMDVLELQEIELDELSLDDVAIDGELELELSDIEAEAPTPEAAGETGEAPAEAEPIELVEFGDDAAEEFTEGAVEEPGLAVEEAPDENALALVGEEAGSATDGSGQAHFDIPGAQADNAALADTFLRGLLPGFGRGDRNASPGAGRKMLAQKGLTATLALYDALKPMIEQVAAGNRTSAQFEFDAAALGTTDHWWTPGELGASGMDDQNLGNCLMWKEGVDTGALMSALLEDCPYHLYWFDKTRGFDMNYGWDSDGSRVRLSALKIMMVVAKDYAADTYTVNALPAYVSSAVANINSIVINNASKGDLEKVTTYADVICNYVEYNHPAADNDGTPYGDPWQLVWIFDGDPDTKVVCEGYAKGFKYLCDLSTFQGNVGCVLAQGMMSGGTGAGPHMWNSLRMDDGRVYLVDLTNCDAGNTCDYTLFLKGATGDAGGPYVCKGLRYEFYDWIKEQFGGNSPWLTYSGADYGKEEASGGDGTVNAEWTALQAQINAAADNTTVKLTNNITASGGNVGLEIPAGKRLTLDLAGHTLDRGLKAEKNNGYVLGVSGSLTLVDSVGGGKITGGWTSTYGGGIYVDYGASLTVAGGEISGNRAFDGGGIGAPNGTIVISGGRIADNDATSGGGGVKLEGGKIEMNGGEITGNRACFGGGIYVINASFEMKDGKITDNDAYDPDAGTKHVESGGGVYAYASTVIMSGGEISGNRANITGGNGAIYHPMEHSAFITSGGGIFLRYGSFKMNGGTIKNNTSSYGGGVRVEDAEFVMTSGAITGNTGYTGGGVQLHACADADTAAFTMKGGEISDNSAEIGGSGVYIWGTNGNNAIFKITGGTIKGNTGEASGGGLFIYAGYGDMSGGTIADNKARAEGGVFLQYSTFRMSGGMITGNHGNHVGGVCCPDKEYGGGELILIGDPVIADNYRDNADGTKTVNNAVTNDNLIQIEGPLGSNARIGIYGEVERIFTSGLGAGGNIGAFFSDDPNYTIAWSADGQEAQLVRKETPTDPTQPTQPTQPTDPTDPTQPTQPTDPTTPTEPVIVPLSDCKITVKNQSYTGKAIKAKVTVTYGDVTLQQGTDYTVSYKNNKAIGVATATVNGLGNYIGTKKVTFKILPRVSSVSKLTAGKQTLTVTWKKRTEATGYQVQYALKSNFSGAKTVKIKKNKTVKATIKSLKTGKTYYVRVRTYKTVGKKTYYSAWSKAKKVKVK